MCYSSSFILEYFRTKYDVCVSWFDAFVDRYDGYRQSLLIRGTVLSKNVEVLVKLMT